jgi:hypothetical protein
MDTTRTSLAYGIAFLVSRDCMAFGRFRTQTEHKKPGNNKHYWSSHILSVLRITISASSESPVHNAVLSYKYLQQQYPSKRHDKSSITSPNVS